MPTTQVLTPPTAQQEPITLALAIAALRLDLDLVSTDPAIVGQRELLQLQLRAARELVEAHTGRYFAAQQVALTYELGEGYLLPAGATATSVSGFFTTLTQLEDATAYVEEYRKGISISRELPWGEAIRQTYTVVADVTPDPQFVGLATAAMLELAAEWYKNRETTSEARGLSELPVSWRVKLAQAVIRPLGY